MGPRLGRVGPVCVLLATLALPAAARAADLSAAARAGRLREELNYLVSYRGQVLGTKRVRVYDAEREGCPAVRVATREVTLARARGISTRTTIDRVEFTDPDGYGILLRETKGDAGQVTVLNIEVTGDAVLFQEYVDAWRRLKVPRTRPVRFDLDGRALARAGKLRPGEKLSDLVAARIELGIAELVAEVLECVALPAIEGVMPAGAGYRLRISNDGGREDPWEIVCDESGRTVEFKVGPMVERLVGPREARLPRTAAELDNRFQTRRVTGLGRVKSMTVEVIMPEGAREDLFPDSIYGTTGRGGKGEYILTLTEARPDGRLPREDLSEEDRAQFLGPSRHVQSDDRDIVRFAEVSVGGVTEPLKKALYLARRVYEYLRKTSRGPATASAVEALRRGAGDCTEHSVLLVALARAVGIPARQALGLVHDGTGFQFHAWTELYIENRWVPVDPTLGRMGVPGLYVLLGREGGKVGYHNRANALQGTATMHIVEVEEVKEVEESEEPCMLQ